MIVGASFAASISDCGKAAKSFEEDLRECRQRGVRGFPAFLIRNSKTGKELLLNGHRQFSEISEAFRKLGGNEIQPDFPTADKESILAFVRRSANTAPREVVEVFDLQEADARRYLDSLVSDGALRRRQVGNGFFYSAM